MPFFIGEKMKKPLIALSLGLLLAAASWAGTVNCSGRAGLYTSPTGGSSSLMYGVTAAYAIDEHLSLRGAVDTTTFTAGGVQTTYTPVSLDLIYSQYLQVNLSAYGGAGVSYNATTAGGSTTSTAGGQAEVGFKVALGGMDAGLEWRWLVPDLNHLDKWGTYSNAYVTGGFSQSFSL